MKQSLLAALQEPGNLSVRFQPVFELVDRPNPIHALEALVSGPQGTHFADRKLLMEYVRRKKAEALIDRDVATAVFRAAESLPANVRIHLPVHISTLLQNQGFPKHVESQGLKHGIAPDRITIELMESEPGWEPSCIARVLNDMRKMGVRLCVSDVGVGNSAWKLLIEQSPDYVKLSPYLSQGASQDFKKRTAIESILGLAKCLGSYVVGAGIESPEDLAALAILGLQYVQAEFLCPAISVDALLRSDALQEGPLDGGRRGDSGSVFAQ